MKAHRVLLSITVFLASLIGGSVYWERHAPQELLSSVAAHVPSPKAPRFEFEIEGVQAEAYVVESASGEGIAGVGEDKQFSVASLTKVMTALVALEYGEGRPVLMTPTAKSVTPKRSSVPVGAMLDLKSALTLLLVESDNDVAEAIAESMGPYIDPRLPSGRDAFVRAMNKKAQNLGMTGTHFENPTGLDSPGHYSTARDFAKLANYTARKFPWFWDVTASFPRAVRTLAGAEVPVSTTNLLAGLPGLVGAKTGLSDEAEGALLLRYRITEFPEDLTIVILRSPDRFRDGELILKELKRVFARPYD